MTAGHLGEDAELYALGALDVAESQTAEAHVASCPACRARVSEAAAVTAAFAAGLHAAAPSRALARRIAGIARGRQAVSRGFRSSAAFPSVLAAVFAVGFVAVGSRTLVLQDRTQADERAFQAIVRSHFKHTSATIVAPSDLSAAKVLYAADGSWLYVLAENARGGTLHAIDVTPGTGPGRDLGALATVGTTSSLFVRPAGRVRTIVIEERGAVVAHAALTYR